MPPPIPPTCPVTASAGGWAHNEVIAILAVISAATYVVTAWSIWRGWRWRAVGAAFVTPIGAYLAAAGLERRNLVEFYDSAHQSWGKIFADQLLPMFMAGLLVMLWVQLIERSWRCYRVLQALTWVAAIGGATWAVSFRFGENKTYDVLQHFSIGKLIHDALVGPYVAAVLFLTILSILWTVVWGLILGRCRQVWWIVGLLVVLVGAFGFCLSHDAHGLIPGIIEVRDTWNPLPHRIYC